MASERTRRHTGRQRNEAARQAILRAALRQLRSGKDLTMEAIAETAEVGKQTIYRWWPTKGAVLAEALAQQAHTLARVPDTGTVHGDLAAFLTDTFAGAAKPANRRMLRRLMAAAQQDNYLAETVAHFTAARRHELHALLQRGQQRGQLAAETDLDMLIDQAYGFLWYRLLVGHGPLDQETAHRLTSSLLAAA